MKGKIRSICESFTFNVDGFVSYLIAVTMLLTVILVMSVGGSYQIEEVEASVSQTSNTTSSVLKLVEQGNALYNMSKYEEAITWYDKALEIEPRHVDALVHKGLALFNLGRSEEAITWFDKALEIDPENINALYNKGLILYNLGNMQDALIWIDKALAIDPRNQLVLDLKSRLQE